MSKITPAELNRLLADQPDLPLIDVTTPAEYGSVHVARAKNVPLTEFDTGSVAAHAGRPVYLLCRSGTRAQIAAEKLASANSRSEGIVVDGGTLGWMEAGLPVVRGERDVISLERQVRLAAGTLVLTGILLGTFVHPGFFALSGFVGAGLVFAGLTDWCGMGLLLARAPWNQRKTA